MYSKELKVAVSAVEKACKICVKVQNNFAGQNTIEKKDRSPVTIADFAGQAIINLELIKNFPQDFVVSEEDTSALRKRKELLKKITDILKIDMENISEFLVLDAIDHGKKSGGPIKKFWTIDPIDGTKGFIRGDQYAVALALVENGSPVLGVLGCPNFVFGKREEKGGIFYAVKGEGAFVKKNSYGTIQKISVGKLSDISHARFCESVESAHADHKIHARIASVLGIKNKSLRIDSQAKYAAVATGLASMYFRIPKDKKYKEKIWDHAAGAIIVEEAGGRVTDLDGKSLDFSLGKTLSQNRGILATNDDFHDEIIKAIRG